MSPTHLPDLNYTCARPSSTCAPNGSLYPSATGSLLASAEAAALERALARGPVGEPSASLPGVLEPFTWGSVFRRVESVWRLAMGRG
jgi:hypothetical protein